MASEITPTCDLVLGYLRCNLLNDTIDIDLKIHTLRGIHTCKKDRSSHINRYSPWGSEITPFPSLKKKMIEFVRQREATTTLFNFSDQPKPKATAAKECTLVTITRPNKDDQ